jgi:hypothetical protein
METAMKTIHLAIATVALLALTVTGHAEFLKHGTAGCANPSDFETFVQLAIKKQDAAATAFSRSHDCRSFDKGEEVLREKFKDGIPCIRGRGDKICYWVVPAEKQEVSNTQQWEYPSLGCSNIDEFKVAMKAMGTFMTTKNPKPLDDYVTSHDCKYFKPGNQIIMGEHRETYLACIRKPEDRVCYWVFDLSMTPK